MALKIIVSMRNHNVYSCEAIAKRLIGIDSDIRVSAHILYGSGSKFADYVKNRVGFNYEHIFSTDHMFDLYKNDPLDMNFLKAAGKKYANMDLWKIAFMERDFNSTFHWEPCNKYSDEEILRWIQAGIKHVEHIIAVCKPDFWFDIFTVQFIRQIVFGICQYNGIRWLRPSFVRVGSYTTIIDTNLAVVPGLSKRYFELKKNRKLPVVDGQNAVKRFREEKRCINDNFENRPEWLQTRMHQDVFRLQTITKLMSPAKVCRYFWTILNGQLAFLMNREQWKCSHRRIPPFKIMQSRIKQSLNKMKVKMTGLPKKHYDNRAPFFLFPLSTIPEEQTEIRSPILSDEFFLVRATAQSLPIDCRLYVKEHPNMYYKRPHSFYRRMQSLAKVEVLDAHLPIIPLIEKSEGVITIGSTVGYEATFLKKPVIHFGQVDYDFIESILYVEDVRDLPKILKEARQIEHDEYTAMALMQAVMDTCFTIDLQIWNQNAVSTEMFLNGHYSKDINLLAINLYEKLMETKDKR